MLGMICAFLLTYFAATLYAAVILIQTGGWMPILAGLLLLCSYFTCGALMLAGIAAADKKQKMKGEAK